ncbi:MAG: PEP-CTERM sorting domain-containing protein [Pseudomonadota bacterium]
MHIRNITRQVLSVASLAVAAAASTPSVHALTIEFDYSLDTGFFDDPERRERLEQAASFFEMFSDTLSPIQTGGGDTWEIAFNNPSNLGQFAVVENRNVASDTVVIYVGASAFNALGFATNGTLLNVEGTAAFQDALLTRGQENTEGPNASDYGTWGGAISFSSNPDWYFGESADGLGANQNDFLTTATHEIAHILGFGGADSWFSQLVTDMAGNLVFEGAASMSVFGGPVPTVSAAHWAEGTMSFFNGMPQETLMDPTTPAGVRQLMTLLDFAALSDIGWESVPVPLPATAWLFLCALGALGHTARRR